MGYSQLLEEMISMPGQQHGPSIKKPRVYEALRRRGYSKSKAAAISNSMAKARKGKGRKSSGRRRGRR